VTGAGACTLLAAFLPGFCGGALLYLSALLVNTKVLPALPWTAGAALVATFGAPSVLLLFVLGTIFQVGLDGKSLTEDMREWWAGLCARVLLCAAGWLALFAIPIFGGWLLLWAGQQGWCGKLVNAVLGSTWVGTTVAGILGGWSSRTGQGRQPGALDWLTRLAPRCFSPACLP
jgi:hypothetical protein